MDDAALVRGLDRRRHLAADVERFGDGERPSREALGQALSLDELEDQVERAVHLFEAVDRGDVRMAERGQQLRFALEAGERGSASPATAEGSALIATVRSRRVSRAR